MVGPGVEQRCPQSKDENSSAANYTNDEHRYLVFAMYPESCSLPTR